MLSTHHNQHSNTKGNFLGSVRLAVHWVRLAVHWVRLAVHWQLLISVLLAGVLTGPTANLCICEEHKTETSDPVEERIDLEEIVSTLDSFALRRAGPRDPKANRSSSRRGSGGITGRRVCKSRFVRFYAGHRLANGLLAPLHC